MKRFRALVERFDLAFPITYNVFVDSRADAIAVIASRQGATLKRIVHLRSYPIPKYATPCQKCGIPDDDVYMVHDDLWLAVNGGYDGQMCFACFQKLFAEYYGRQLTKDDLKPAVPCNALTLLEWGTLMV